MPVLIEDRYSPRVVRQIIGGKEKIAKLEEVVESLAATAPNAAPVSRKPRKNSARRRAPRRA